MKEKAGLSGEPHIPPLETKRLNPSEVQQIITRSNFDTLETKTPIDKEFSPNFYDEYYNSTAGSENIKKLIKNGRNITAEDIRQSFIIGLNADLIVAKKIPELSNYQPEDIAKSFTTHFSLFVESISRISTNNPVSKAIIKQLIERPNYFKPNIYEEYVKQISPESYYTKTNIYESIVETPKNVNLLKSNSDIFEYIINTYKEIDSPLTINYRGLREIVEKLREVAINTVKESPEIIYLSLDGKEDPRIREIKKIPISKPTNNRVNLDTELTIKKYLKEYLLALKLTPSHPIDHNISSQNLTTEQQQKLVKDENILDEWKSTLSANFNDSWILKHFIIYYPNDYKNRYDEAKNAFDKLRTKYNKYEFATPDILKDIVVYYFENADNATNKGIYLLADLKKDFLETKLIDSKPSSISKYIIRNFNNPADDLRNANEQFNKLLKNATENPDDFFHSQSENEIRSETYLRLLFESHPIETESSIPKIKDVYEQLQTEFENDDFFEKYKNSFLKKIAILSTGKPVLNYHKLKSKIQGIANKPENQEIPFQKILTLFLFSTEDIPTGIKNLRLVYSGMKS